VGQGQSCVSIDVYTGLDEALAPVEGYLEELEGLRVEAGHVVEGMKHEGGAFGEAPGDPYADGGELAAQGNIKESGEFAHGFDGAEGEAEMKEIVKLLDGSGGGSLELGVLRGTGVGGEACGEGDGGAVGAVLSLDLGRGLGADVEDVGPDCEHVAGFQGGSFDGLAVDVGCVAGLEVLDADGAAVEPDFGVSPGEGGIVEADVAAIAATDAEGCGCDLPACGVSDLICENDEYACLDDGSSQRKPPGFVGMRSLTCEV